MNSNPRVSIGVPVYNGEKYIRQTIDSLLAQTFGDFEIIVTDNCSTDSTPQIIAEYITRDPRIRYVRNQINLGPARNYKVSMDLARGALFKWNSADDVCAPDFLEKCVRVLDADPSVVLAYPRTKVIDATGAIVDQYEYEIDLNHPDPSVRLWRIMTVDHKQHGAHELYGVIRTAELRKTPGMRVHVRGDSVLLARFVLLGRLRRIDEYLFLIATIQTDPANTFPVRKSGRAAGSPNISAVARFLPPNGGIRR